MSFEGEGTGGGLLILAPGRSENDQGAVFTAPSGHLLRKFVASESFPAVRFEYFCQEPLWKPCFADSGLTTKGLVWLNHFKERLKVIKPKVIVTLGQQLAPVFTRYSASQFSAVYCYVIRQNAFGIPVIPTYRAEDCYVTEFANSESDEDDPFSVETERVACQRQFWIRVALRKAKTILTEPTPKYPLFITNNDPTAVSRYLALAERAPKVTLDIETVDKPNWKLSAFSVSVDTNSAMAVTPDIGDAAWNAALASLRRILENPAIEKVGQNWVGFDQQVLHRNYGFGFAGKLWDTQDSFAHLFPNFRKGLAEQARLYLDCEPWKGHHDTQGEQLRLYAAKDTWITAKLQAIHEKELAEFGQLDHYRKYIQPVCNLAMDLQQRGIRVDEAKRQEMVVAADKIRDELIVAMRQLTVGRVAPGQKKSNKRDPKNDIRVNSAFQLDPAVAQKLKRPEAEAILASQGLPPASFGDFYIAKKQDQTKYGLVPGAIYKRATREEITFVEREFNPNSPPQLLSVFENFKAKLPKVKKAKGKWGESTNVKSLLKLMRSPAVAGDLREFVKLLLRFRKIDKIVSTYFKAKLDADSRWRCSYSVGGTSTGRSSTRKTAFDTGGNNQNIPRDPVEGFKFKDVFLADPGKILVNRDQTAAEALLVAYMADCPKMIELLTTGQDIHVYFISAALGEDVSRYKESDPKKFKYLRHCGKGGNHSGNYGTGPATLSDMFLVQGVDVPVEQCRHILDARRKIFPEIYENFQQGVIADLHRDRTLVTPFGRKRKFFGPLDDNTYREAFAYKPQSTVPYLTNLQWRWLVDYAAAHPDAGIEVLAMVHDNLLWQQAPETLDTTLKAFDEFSKSVILDINGHKVVMPWDCSTGPAWGSLSNYKVKA